MRILFVISTLGIGGEQKAANILTGEFASKGHSVKILCLGGPEQKMFSFHPNVEIEFANCCGAKMKHLARCRAIVSCHNSFKSDLIIAFALFPSIYCSALRHLLRTPVIVTERNDPAVYPLTIRAIRRMTYPSADFGIFQTTAAARYFSYITERKKAVIPNPVDFDRMPKPFQGDRKMRICNTARLVPAKRQDDLIRAFAAVHEKFPDYSLVIYGDGPLRDNLKTLAKELGVGDSVFINDAIPNVLERIVEDSVFVLSSNNEGFPNSLVEALSMGLACVSTDCRIGGPADMIKSGYNGLLVPVGDIEAMANSIESILSDKTYMKALSENAAQEALRFDKRKIAEKWISCMENLVRENS